MAMIEIQRLLATDLSTVGEDIMGELKTLTKDSEPDADLTRLKLNGMKPLKVKPFVKKIRATLERGKDNRGDFRSAKNFASVIRYILNKDDADFVADVNKVLEATFINVVKDGKTVPEVQVPKGLKIKETIWKNYVEYYGTLRFAYNLKYVIAVMTQKAVEIGGTRVQRGNSEFSHTKSSSESYEESSTEQEGNTEMGLSYSNPPLNPDSLEPLAWLELEASKGNKLELSSIIALADSYGLSESKLSTILESFSKGKPVSGNDLFKAVFATSNRGYKKTYRSILNKLEKDETFAQVVDLLRHTGGLLQGEDVIGPTYLWSAKLGSVLMITPSEYRFARIPAARMFHRDVHTDEASPLEAFMIEFTENSLMSYIESNDQVKQYNALVNDTSTVKEGVDWKIVIEEIDMKGEFRIFEFS